MNYKIQVDPHHYEHYNYEHLERFISYYDQKQVIFNALKNIDNAKVLEIGVGSGFLNEYLKKHRVNIKTFDIDSRLNPDYVGDLLNIHNLVNEKFDIIACFEVLEHLEFSDFENAIKNMQQMNPKYFLMSIPQSFLYFSFWFKLNIFGIFKKYIYFPFPIVHKFDGQHYWELGKKGYGLKKVKAIIQKYFEIEKSYTNPLNTYHRFFVLKPKNNI